MTYEVENKYPVDDLPKLEERLAELGAEIGQPQTQVDCYYKHPVRDFAETDEALRIRRVDEENRFTYKGPKIDQTTKTRREVELPFAPGDAAASDADELLKALGFEPVMEVRKQRRPVAVPWQGREVEGALDDVAGLGTYIELELTADDSDLDAARDCLASLAKRLDLHDGERRSYLELLLEQQQQ